MFQYCQSVFPGSDASALTAAEIQADIFTSHLLYCFIVNIGGEFIHILPPWWELPYKYGPYRFTSMDPIGLLVWTL